LAGSFLKDFASPTDHLTCVALLFDCPGALKLLFQRKNMSIKPGSNDIPTVIKETGVRATGFFKACMLSALFLPVLLASQPAKDVEVVNDTVGDMQVVVAGSSGLNFGVVYNRELEDCTVLDFEAVQNKLPVAMRDNEGNKWDVLALP
jgi:hypothetical protein